MQTVEFFKDITPEDFSNNPNKIKNNAIYFLTDGSLYLGTLKIGCSVDEYKELVGRIEKLESN